MKRDIDLGREILRQIEAHQHLNAPVEVKVEGRSSDEITYQLYLLSQESLIEAITARYKTGPGLTCLPTGLTPKGHDFLKASRDDTIWRRGKGLALRAGGDIAYSMLSDLLKTLVRKGTGLGL